jgi:hypothetical protein
VKKAVADGSWGSQGKADVKIILRGLRGCLCASHILARRGDGED